jgi:Xaa-Pro dipeptidase
MLVNATRIKEFMRRNELEALVGSTPGNVTYLTDYRSFSQEVLKVPIFALMTKDLEAALVVPTDEIGDILTYNLTKTKNLNPYGTYFIETGDKKLRDVERKFSEYVKQPKADNAVDALAALLTFKGLNKSRIGVDEGGMILDNWDKLVRALPEAQLVRANAILENIRMVKTKGEVDRIRKATHIVEHAIDQTLRIAKPNVSGTELADEFTTDIVNQGGHPLFWSIGIGARSHLNNMPPSPEKLKKGDLIRFDVGCKYENYCTDMARSAVMGKPTDKQRQYYQALLEGQEAALKSVRPGVRASELFEIAMKTVKARGIPQYKRHHCGHGIGIELYDPPLIAPRDDRALEESMVFCVETPYYELEFGGLQVEDVIVVTNKGYEPLSESSKELRSI